MTETKQGMRLFWTGFSALAVLFGPETPTGVFVVLQKDKHHTSSTCSTSPVLERR